MDSKQKHTITQIKFYKESLCENDISLTKILESEKFQTIINECREFRDRVYTPLKTILVFIKQVLDSDKSCKNAVAGVVVEQKIIGKTISNNTGPYCKARDRLPEECVYALVKETGKALVNESKDNWKWRQRDVKVADGSTLLMQDTEENQVIFPQHKSQAKGAGFPIARLVAVMSLSVGTVLDYAIDAFKGKGTGEGSLLRRILDCINPDDILLGDCYYPSYFLIADLQARKADGLFQGQGQRNYDFRTGEFLGKKDHVATWQKPTKPSWMEEETYALYPEQIKVREFKMGRRVYITTLLNGKKYNKKELFDLYSLRWQVEINLKSIKSTLKMDMLSCKTPDMVKKEIGVHFLAYNLIRIIIAEACSKDSLHPNHISFKGTIQLLNQFMPHFLSSNNNLYADLLQMIVKNRIGNRPGRVEPRVVKRRRKPFPLLHKKRSILKTGLLIKKERELKQVA